MGEQKYIEKQKQTKSTLVPFILGASGIYFCYILLGILSEKIYSTEFESNVQFNLEGIPEKHRFQTPTLCVCFSALLCSFFGFIKGKSSKQVKNPMKTQEQMLLGFLFALTLMTTVYSLLYVSYLTHVVACNCRYLFVVVIGAYFSRVQKKSNLKLSTHKIVIALILTSGILLFNLVNHHDSADHHLKQSTQWKGYALIIVSVIASGLFGDAQAYNKSISKPSANHLFFSANFYCLIFCAIFSLIQGGFFPSIRFAFQHTQFLVDLILMSVLQVFGQISIYFVISNFKQHIFPLISTSRKLITVFFSILIFNHQLVFWQWVGLAIVIIGMLIQVLEQTGGTSGKTQKKEANQQKKQ